LWLDDVTIRFYGYVWVRTIGPGQVSAMVVVRRGAEVSGGKKSYISLSHKSSRDRADPPVCRGGNLPSVVYNNIRLIEIGAAEQRARPIARRRARPPADIGRQHAPQLTRARSRQSVRAPQLGADLSRLVVSRDRTSVPPPAHISPSAGGRRILYLLFTNKVGSIV